MSSVRMAKEKISFKQFRKDREANRPSREEALARLENEIEEFEKKYNMSSDEFEKRFGSGDIGCHVDFISWHHANIGLKRLKAGRVREFSGELSTSRVGGVKRNPPSGV